MPSPVHPPSLVGVRYSALTSTSYIFNVIVGTGALAIPGVVAHSGYLISALILILFAFMSYITVTYVVESMAISNAVILSSSLDELEPEHEDEDDPLISTSINSRQILHRDSFDILRTVEMGHMAKLFFPRIGQVLFYVTIIVYLYGDLAIYVTAISKSLRDVLCQKNQTIPSCSSYLPESIDRTGLYRLICILFILAVGPFSFLTISKTKYLQIATTLLRWTAFITMIVIAIKKIGSEPALHPVISNPIQLPLLFGTAVYSFMCHHSIPSLVTPIANKRSLHLLFSLDYALIATFYILLSTTAVFAFPYVQDLYTLNFIHETGLVSYLLPLFPVFTLSSNFPIISITLKNNLQTLLNYESNFSNTVYTLLAIVPPFLVSIFVEDVQVLVNFTGSFAGAGIQYIIPCLLIHCARKKVGNLVTNPYQSPFTSHWWVRAVLVWTFVSVLLVAVHMFY